MLKIRTQARKKKTTLKEIKTPLPLLSYPVFVRSSRSEAQPISPIWYILAGFSLGTQNIMMQDLIEQGDLRGLSALSQTRQQSCLLMLLNYPDDQYLQLSLEFSSRSYIVVACSMAGVLILDVFKCFLQQEINHASAGGL
ncbi:uncharacterized protein LOC112190607 isoform X2 [Rosa chinensis]|uniref:uncharacterized protein LOC112190607 isoform X2 n=1 Tax=Rosa chinensis TaxID=74649 RepID=UPI001AD8D5FB|nr:uncharacterized protein LOC112190607 isoform X2 [Rosa chinensis]